MNDEQERLFSLIGDTFKSVIRQNQTTVRDAARSSAGTLVILCRRALEAAENGRMRELNIAVRAVLVQLLLDFSPCGIQPSIEEAIRLFEDACDSHLFEPLSDYSEPARELIGLLHAFMGVAYTHRVFGARSDNVEAAIVHFESALRCAHFSTEPRLVAGINHYLGALYTQRRIGNHEDNANRAIMHCDTALRGLANETTTLQWAVIQSDLGLAHLLRTDDENDEALSHLNAALTALSADANPRPWAHCHFRIGLAYLHRPVGERATNLEAAIAHFLKCLTVFGKVDFTAERSQALLDLGRAYTRLDGNNERGNLDRAIDVLEQAALLCAESSETKMQASIGLALANAYLKRIADISDVRRAAELLRRSLPMIDSRKAPGTYNRAAKSLRHAEQTLSASERADQHANEDTPP